MRRLAPVACGILAGLAPRQPGATRPLTDWEQVASWTGSVTSTTVPFTIAGEDWRVNWTAQPASFTGSVQIVVYRDINQVVGIAANQASEAAMEGSTPFRGSGTYYLGITSANVDWAVSVDESR